MVEDAFIIPPLLLLLLLLRAKGTTLRSGSVLVSRRVFRETNRAFVLRRKKRFVKLLFSSCAGNESEALCKAFVLREEERSSTCNYYYGQKGTTLRSGSRFGVSSCVSGSKKRFVKLLFCGGKEEEVFYV